MKLGKPVYDSANKLYKCPVNNGVRFSVRKEEGKFVKELQTFLDKDMMAEHIVKATYGWFTKPLTQDYLKERLRGEFPTCDDSFEGEVEFELQGLTISKEIFLLRYGIVSMKEDEKVCIEFEDDIEVPLEKEVGPTRRQIVKQKVLQSRAKAARALFMAERLTQEYYEEFGEDTDWEDETLSD